MIEIVSDNIVSPLGVTSEENYLNVKAGKSGIRTYDSLFGLDCPVSCGKMDDALIDSEFGAVVGNNDDNNYTRLEKLALISSTKAVRNSGIDASGSDVAFYLSTTKGNVSLLDDGVIDSHKLYLYDTARLQASHFDNKQRPVVVSNACISGLSAIIAASRALESGRIKYAVVTGVDVLSRFVFAGFMSLKALSSKLCKPYDGARCGLNLGEAAATVVLKKADADSHNVKLIKGSVRNDAYHISSPSRTAEGAYNALHDVIDGVDYDDIAFVNTHGTATFFNDEMESIVLDRMGLGEKPINALKGYYGHTLGAAGVLETIIAKHSIIDNTIVKTFGYQERGTSKKISPTTENLATDKPYFVKLISGFGGTNAAALFKREV